MAAGSFTNAALPTNAGPGSAAEILEIVLQHGADLAPSVPRPNIYTPNSAISALHLVFSRMDRTYQFHDYGQDYGPTTIDRCSYTVTDKMERKFRHLFTLVGVENPDWLMQHPFILGDSHSWRNLRLSDFDEHGTVKILNETCSIEDTDSSTTGNRLCYDGPGDVVVADNILSKFVQLGASLWYVQ